MINNQAADESGLIKILSRGQVQTELDLKKSLAHYPREAGKK